MKLLVVVQARMGSTRLPGKVMLPLGGKPLLARMLERVRAALTSFDVTVATTYLAEDEPIRCWGRRLGVRVFEGHPTDLLERHFRAGLAAQADVVVKIPSDCPLIDPAAIDRVLQSYLAAPGAFDFVTNLDPPSWPDGNDVEVIPMPLLELATRQAAEGYEREHTTPFIWQRPDRFRILNVRWQTGLDYSRTHRFTIDHAADYLLVRTLFEALCTEAKPVFSLMDMLGYLEQHPEVRLFNAPYHGASYRQHIPPVPPMRPPAGMAPPGSP